MGGLTRSQAAPFRCTFGGNSGGVEGRGLGKQGALQVHCSVFEVLQTTTGFFFCNLTISSKRRWSTTLVTVAYAAFDGPMLMLD